MEIRRATNRDIPAIAGMAKMLFDEPDDNMLQQEFQQFLRNEKDAVFVATISDAYAGFLHMSLRHEYVEGAIHFPVGYMEGIFVEPKFRRQHIAQALAEAGKAWSLKKGCHEMASDAELTNSDSQAFHQKIGFQEANRTVNYIKKIRNKEQNHAH